MKMNHCLTVMWQAVPDVLRETRGRSAHHRKTYLGRLERCSLRTSLVKELPME